MGIKNLNSVINKFNIFPKKKLNEIQLSVVAVDFSLFLYRFMYNHNNPYECFLRQIMLFFRNNILPVYVIDGAAPIEKNILLNKRAIKRERISDELDELLEIREIMIENKDYNGLKSIEPQIIKLEKRCVQFSRDIIQNLIDFFQYCGIPVIQENYESDWILAKLNYHDIVDYVLSEDSDLLAFGAKKIMKNFSLTTEDFILYDRNLLLKELELNNNEFVDMCILCGCDYAPKIKNMNCKKSFELISQHKEIENTNISIDINAVKKARNIFNKKINKNYIKELSNKIIKNDFDFPKMEYFLCEKIEKKYLINQFFKICNKFITHKRPRRSSSPLQIFFNLK